MNKKVLITFTILVTIGISTTVFATPTLSNYIMRSIVVDVTNCMESDTGMDYFNEGTISGNFSLNNWKYSGSYTDTCIDNITLAEGVCGSSVWSGYSHLAAGIVVDCSGYDKHCYRGECTSKLPDLKLEKMYYQTYSYNSTHKEVYIQSEIKNLEPVIADPSTGLTKIMGWPTYMEIYEPNLIVYPYQTVVMNISVYLEPGNYTIVSYADYYNELPELNDLNNYDALYITV